MLNEKFKRKNEFLKKQKKIGKYDKKNMYK